MLNHCVLAGRINNFFFKDDKLVIMIKHSNKDGDLVLPVYTTFKPVDAFMDYLQNELFIGIKGYITLNEDSQVTIMAEKISFLAPGGEKNESN
jgi:hypothetical protein